jgi:SAM-dependent methyltransferase
VRRPRRSPEAPLLANAQRCEYEALVARIAAEGHERVLDWGCGYGQVTDLLDRAGVAVEALDYGGESAPDAPVALPRFPHLQAFQASDPVTLPYPDEHFSAVLSCGVLEHVHDPDASLDEIRRVLRPNGTFLVYKLPNARSYLEWVARHTGLDYHGQLPNDRLYTPESAHELVERHGFVVDELRYANMLPLTVPAETGRRTSVATWRLNRFLARAPLLNRFATNIELVASRPAMEPTFDAAP